MGACQRKKQDIMSGDPQDTVLAAILFVIMISDIDEKVNEFELVNHKKTNNIEVDPYKTPSGDLIIIKHTAKKLSVYLTNDIKIKNHKEQNNRFQ